MAFPYYLAIGMSYELYWYGSPNIVKAYHKAHEIRNQQRNQEMWFQGLYNYRAFGSVAANLAYSFSGGKGKKPEGYFDEPIPLTEEDKQRATNKNIQRTLEWVNANQ